MLNFIRFLVHEPFLSGVVTFCLLLVGGLVLSGWAEKRRTRALLKIRDDLKELHRQHLANPDEVAGYQAESAPQDLRDSRPFFRLFRWEFALLSAIAVAVILPRIQGPMKIEAKATAQNPEAEQPKQDSLVATEARTTQPAPASTTQSETPHFLAGIGLTLSEPKSDHTDILSLKTDHRLVNCAALFEESSNSDEEVLPSTDGGEFRRNYPVQADAFTSVALGGRR